MKQEREVIATQSGESVPPLVKPEKTTSSQDQTEPRPLSVCFIQALEVMMARHLENTGFICGNCDKEVHPVTNGSYRNHCPFCLYSRHLDITPGDRMNPCKGLMRPKRLVYKSQKGWQIVHLCTLCGGEGRCKIALDTHQADDQVSLAILGGEGL